MTMTRKALGRGLSALIPDVESPLSASPTPSLQHIPVSLVDPNPFQPRRSIEQAKLKELADSITSTGVVQPILVRRKGERYELVAGERRWRAASMADLEVVPAIVRELPDQEALELALTENILREDLSPLEVAHAYHSLQEKFGYSHESIASRLGIDRSTVTNTLRLLKLPSEVQKMIDEKVLSSGHARALLACENPDEQVKLAHRIVQGGLSVRQVEKLASPGRRASHPKETQSEAPKQDPNIKAAVLEMERTLGTRVRITGDENRGRIEILYFSSQDLDRLHGLLTKK
jgi:ParB family transcriptional regulator, chromosome partitioning protein